MGDGASEANGKKSHYQSWPEEGALPARPRTLAVGGGVPGTRAVASALGMQLVSKLEPSREGAGEISTPFPPVLQLCPRPTHWSHPDGRIQPPPRGDKGQTRSRERVAQ